MRHISLLLIAASVCVAGCRSYPKAARVEERVEAVTPENTDALREAYKREYPDSQIGVVAAAINHEHGRFVAVGGLDVSKLAEGQVVTFIDAKQKPLATGTIVAVLPDSVHVRVDPTPGSRDPRVGDLMIRF